MWEAIKLLKCARLDHGVRAMEDPACIAFLVETQVPLTVCPRSNYMVGSPHCLHVVASPSGCGCFRRRRRAPARSSRFEHLKLTIAADTPTCAGGLLKHDMLSASSASLMPS